MRHDLGPRNSILNWECVSFFDGPLERLGLYSRAIYLLASCNVVKDRIGAIMPEVIANNSSYVTRVVSG